MTKLAFLGAGGKMGRRICAKLMKDDFSLRCVETAYGPPAAPVAPRTPHRPRGVRLAHGAPSPRRRQEAGWTARRVG